MIETNNLNVTKYAWVVNNKRVDGKKELRNKNQSYEKWIVRVVVKSAMHPSI